MTDPLQADGTVAEAPEPATGGAGVPAGGGAAAGTPDAPEAPDGATGDGPVDVPTAVFRMMAVTSVEVALPDQYPLLTLVETEGGGRRLAFRIGLPEGVALAHARAGTMAARPLTHDLFADVLERLAVEVVAVRLVGRYGATYLAQLDLMGPRGREVVACRPSDGIILALHQRVAAPILADERLLATSGDVPGASA